MKNKFIGSLVSIFIICIHELKHLNDLFLLLYFVIYALHLSGRPIYNISVLQIYYIHRTTECLVLLQLPFLYKVVISIVVYFFLRKRVILPPLFAFFTFWSLPICKSLTLYFLEIVLMFSLNATVVLFDLPVRQNNVEEYFHIRMTKNFLLAAIVWLRSKMSLISLPIIFAVNILYYYFIEEDDPIEKEYFINEIPNIYPIPLDIKDSIRHCNMAKSLFKKQAI